MRRLVRVVAAVGFGMHDRAVIAREILVGNHIVAEYLAGRTGVVTVSVHQKFGVAVIVIPQQYSFPFYDELWHQWDSKRRRKIT